LHKPPLTEIGNHNSSSSKRQKQQQQKPLQRQQLQHFWLEFNAQGKEEPDVQSLEQDKYNAGGSTKRPRHSNGSCQQLLLCY